jgi:hypothetical protein
MDLQEDGATGGYVISVRYGDDNLLGPYDALNIGVGMKKKKLSKKHIEKLKRNLAKARKKWMSMPKHLRRRKKK